MPYGSYNHIMQVCCFLLSAAVVVAADDDDANASWTLCEVAALLLACCMCVCVLCVCVCVCMCVCVRVCVFVCVSTCVCCVLGVPPLRTVTAHMPPVGGGGALSQVWRRRRVDVLFDCGDSPRGGYARVEGPRHCAPRAAACEPERRVRVAGQKKRGSRQSHGQQACPAGCAAWLRRIRTSRVCAGRPAGTFTGVTFASFGTPTGDCGNFAYGACNSAKSEPVVTAACVGKAACTLTASNDFFGGDPCLGTLKSLSLLLSGDCAAVVVQVSVTIPVGGRAGVRAHIFRGCGGDGHRGRRARVGRRYVPGVPGITGADAVAGGVDVYAGSGAYVFQATV